MDVSAAENPVSHALSVPRYLFYIPQLVVDNTATGLSEYLLRMNFPLDDVSPELVRGISNKQTCIFRDVSGMTFPPRRPLHPVMGF